MKILNKVITIFLLVGLTLVPASTIFAQEEEPEIKPVSSYELFWPITQGKVMGDPLFSLKSFKEGIMEFFQFSNFSKVNYNTTLSEKRIVEAEYLLFTKKDYINGKKSLEAAKEKREKAFAFIKQARQKGENTGQIEARLRISLQKQKILLDFLKTKLPDEQKGILDDSLNNLRSLLSQLG